MYAVWRPCSDFMDMLRHLLSCRIIIIIIIIITTPASVAWHRDKNKHTVIEKTSGQVSVNRVVAVSLSSTFIRLSAGWPKNVKLTH